MASLKSKLFYGQSRLPSSRSQWVMKRVAAMRLACNRLVESCKVDVFGSLSDQVAPKLRCRSRVRELVIAGPHDLVVSVCEAGLATAHSLTTGELVATLNPSNTDMVHTALYNRFNGTLIVVYAPYTGALRCSILLCDQLRRARLVAPPNASIFSLVHLTHPAFFEFDETNNRIGVASVDSQIFEFWDMANYKLVFTHRGEQTDRYEEIRVSDSVLAFLKAPQGTVIPYVLYDIADGTLLSSSRIKLQAFRDVTFLELSSEFLLLKQEGASLRVYNLLTSECRKVAATRNMMPLGFVFYDHPVNPLTEKAYGISAARRFFTICENYIEFWRLQHCIATRLRKIWIPNLLDPEMVCHCSDSSMIAICTGPRVDDYTKTFSSALEQWKGNVNDGPTDENIPALLSQNQQIETPGLIHLISIPDATYVGAVANKTQYISAIATCMTNFRLVVGTGDGFITFINVPNYTRSSSRLQNHKNEDINSDTSRHKTLLQLPMIDCQTKENWLTCEGNIPP